MVVSCGQFHTAAVADDGLLYTVGATLPLPARNSERRRPSIVGPCSVVLRGSARCARTPAHVSRFPAETELSRGKRSGGMGRTGSSGSAQAPPAGRVHRLSLL